MQNRLAVVIPALVAALIFSPALLGKTTVRHRPNRLRQRRKLRPRTPTFPESGTRCAAIMTLHRSARVTRQ
jgi:hypothetical protein